MLPSVEPRRDPCGIPQCRDAGSVCNLRVSGGPEEITCLSKGRWGLVQPSPAPMAG